MKLYSEGWVKQTQAPISTVSSAFSTCKFASKNLPLSLSLQEVQIDQEGEGKKLLNTKTNYLGTKIRNQYLFQRCSRRSLWILDNENNMMRMVFEEYNAQRPEDFSPIFPD